MSGTDVKTEAKKAWASFASVGRHTRFAGAVAEPFASGDSGVLLRVPESRGAGPGRVDVLLGCPCGVHCTPCVCCGTP